jgi:hypothetical protein
MLPVAAGTVAPEPFPQPRVPDVGLGKPLLQRATTKVARFGCRPAANVYQHLDLVLSQQGRELGLGTGPVPDRPDNPC